MKKVLFLSFILCAISFGAFAQDVEKKEEVKVKNQNARLLMLGTELSNYGYENKSAIALLEAARILSAVPTREIKAEKVVFSEKSSEATTTSVEPKTLIADARRFAENDKTIQTLADKVENEIVEASNRDMRGESDACGSGYVTIAPNSYVMYTLTCRAGYVCEVGVVGGTHTDIDAYIYDANGNLIDSDADGSSSCYLSWVPRWTGSFVLQIVNRGRTPNTVNIITN